MVSRTCNRCRHFHESIAAADPPNGGFCWANPPQTHRIVLTDATGEHARWQSARPWVFKSESCALWSTRRRWWLLWLA